MKSIVAAIFLLAACSTCGTVSPKPSSPDCTAACAHGATLGCDWAKPTPNGVACVDVCQSANTILPWNLTCLDLSATCEQAAICR